MINNKWKILIFEGGIENVFKKSFKVIELSFIIKTEDK